MIRNGHLPEREIQTGAGMLKIKQPRVRVKGEHEEQLSCQSKLIPPYLRKAKDIEATMPRRSFQSVLGSSASERPRGAAVTLGCRESNRERPIALCGGGRKGSSAGRQVAAEFGYRLVQFYGEFFEGAGSAES